MVQGYTSFTGFGNSDHGCVAYIQGNDMLGIPYVCMGDGAERVGNSLTNVTTFPAPMVGAASWNTSQHYAFSQALAQEERDKGRNVVLAPKMKILRNPLWGRVGETLSEDTYLISRMAVAAVLGIQSQDMLACAKHFAAHNQETDIFGLTPAFDAYDSLVDERVLHEVYFPAFKAVVQEANAISVICSYKKLNGVYACENSWLLNILKEYWGFKGFRCLRLVFCDMQYCAICSRGLDISMPGGNLTSIYGFLDCYADLLVEAVSHGSVPFSCIEDTVERLWRPMFENGVIDRNNTGDPKTLAQTQAHLDLAQ